MEKPKPCEPAPLLRAASTRTASVLVFPHWHSVEEWPAPRRYVLKYLGLKRHDAGNFLCNSSKPIKVAKRLQLVDPEGGCTGTLCTMLACMCPSEAFQNESWGGMKKIIRTKIFDVREDSCKVKRLY